MMRMLITGWAKPYMELGNMPKLKEAYGRALQLEPV